MLFTFSVGKSTNPTIVFLHGGGGSHWMWRPQIEALQDDYHILAPDLPEHGRSAEMKPFTIAGSVECVAELIRTQAHGGRAHVVGLSEGAQILVALLARAPELVDHAVISSALVRQMTGMNWFGPKFWSVTYKSIEPLNKYDWWIRLNMRSYGIPESFLPDMRETYKSLTANAFANILVENQKFRIPERSALEKVYSPTLVVGGKNEYKIIHESIKDVATAIPGAKGYLVHHSTKMPLNLEHNWNLSTQELFTRTVRSWIEDRPLPEELVPIQ